MNSTDLTIYRRRLPHWRLEGSVYFLTWRLATHQVELTPKERDIVAGALLHFQRERYWLLAYVVMNDHVHVLARPKPEFPLQDVVRSWKSYTAHELVKEDKRKGHVWQDEYFDRIVRDDRELREKAGYILGNPWKRWPGIEDYPWMGCFWDSGQEGT